MLLDFSNQPIPKIHAGRRPVLPVLTSYQIKQEANRLLRSGLSAHAWQTLHHLTVGGIMSVGQLERIGVKSRTLQKYANLQLLTRMPYSSPQMAVEFERWGLPFDRENAAETSLNILGPIGLEIARMQGLSPEEGFLAYPVDRFMQQVVISEIRLRLSQFALEQGWQVKWVDKTQARLTTEEGQVILEPAALMLFEKAGSVLPFFLEFQQKLDLRKIAQTIRMYEKARRTEQWVGETTMLHRFPPLLFVFSEQKVGLAYQQTLAEQEPVRCTYYGKLLKGVLSAEADLGSWVNIHTKERETILPKFDWGKCSPTKLCLT